MVVNQTSSHPCSTTLSFVIGLPLFFPFFFPARYGSRVHYLTCDLPPIVFFFPDKRRTHDHADPAESASSGSSHQYQAYEHLHLFSARPWNSS